MEYLTLSNGLRIVHQYRESAVGYCGFMVDCGSRNETSPELYGIAHFIEHILFKGTKKRNSWHINNRMESVGGELNAFTTKEETTFYTTFLDEDFPRACELLCDLVCNPTAPQHELEKEQEVVVEEIESYRDTPSELIYDEFENRLFAGHDLGHNILGSEETVRGFDSKTCLDFISRHYTADRMVFFYYGKTPFKRVVQCCSKWFNLEGSRGFNVVQGGSIGFNVVQEGSIGFNVVQSGSSLVSNNIEQSLNNIKQPLNNIEQKPFERFVIEQETHQSHVILGARTYYIGSKKSPALALINNLLGGPGMNSRLNIELREKRGLVYTVEGNVSNFTDAGYQSIYFGCDHDDVEKCIRLCKHQLQKMYDTKMSQRQLLAAKKQLKGQLGIATANLENNAIALAKNYLRLGRVDTLEETCARVDAVTAEEIQEIAYEIFAPEKLRCVIIQ